MAPAEGVATLALREILVLVEVAQPFLMEPQCQLLRAEVLVQPVLKQPGQGVISLVVMGIIATATRVERAVLVATDIVGPPMTPVPRQPRQMLFSFPQTVRMVVMVLLEAEAEAEAAAQPEPASA